MHEELPLAGARPIPPASTTTWPPSIWSFDQSAIVSPTGFIHVLPILSEIQMSAPEARIAAIASGSGRHLGQNSVTRNRPFLSASRIVT